MAPCYRRFVAVVSVSSKHSFVFAVVSHIACNACLGVGEVIDGDGWRLKCERCGGVGIADIGAESRYMDGRHDRYLLKNQARARGRR